MRKVEKESTRTASSPSIPINQELEKRRKRAYLEAMEEADWSSSQFLIRRTCSRKTSPERRSVSEEKDNHPTKMKITTCAAFHFRPRIQKSHLTEAEIYLAVQPGEEGCP